VNKRSKKKNSKKKNSDLYKIKLFLMAGALSKLSIIPLHELIKTTL